MTPFIYLLFFLAPVLSQGNFASCDCSYEFQPVCDGNIRYINPCVATCSNSPSAIPCADIRAMNTVTKRGSRCNCPLLDKVVCINNIPYPNPCFAKCEVPDSGYGDYKECPSNVSLLGVVGIGAYPTNMTCNCSNDYSPVCIGSSEYSNRCFANCFRPGVSTSTCIAQYSFISQANNLNCICIYSIEPVCVQGKRYVNRCLAQCDYPTSNVVPC